MHKLVITKTGYEGFDALHTLGLAVFIATAIDEPVRVSNCGISYEVRYSKSPSKSPLNVFDKMTKLPTMRDLSRSSKQRSSMSLKASVFDGLLAALFTTPGSRVVSTQDMLFKQKSAPNIIKLSLEKTSKTVNRWRSFFVRRTKNLTPGEFWGALLSAYSNSSYAIPIRGNTKRFAINILMTLDPGLSYSVRQTLSDGNIAQLCNMTIGNLPFAAIFAFFGATRFLRAQHVNNEMVNFYLPLPANISINPRSALGTLKYSRFPKDVASLMLSMSLVNSECHNSWLGIACQTMQTQHAKQSISIDHKVLDIQWFDQIDRKVIGIWQHLYQQEGQLGFELDNLTDFLQSKRACQLFAHLYDRSLIVRESLTSKIYAYDLLRIKELFQMTDQEVRIPLSAVLLNDKGTLRFGHALRQLRAPKKGVLQDVIDDLERVKSVESLLVILSNAVEACVVQNANYAFTIIPDDQDLFYLLEDVQKFGVSQVASILIVLASLHYPRKYTIESELPSQTNHETREEHYDKE